MYNIYASDIRPTGVDGELEIELDISQLRDFTTLDIVDINLLMYRYSISLDEGKNLIVQSNTTFELCTRCSRKPVLIPVSTYKLGRIIAKNSDYIQLVGDCNTEASQQISDGMFYELSGCR